MRTHGLPDKDHLWKILDYDPQTGLFFWKYKDPSSFKTPRAASTWNSRFANKPALSADSGLGYKIGRVEYATFLAHRVAWKMMTGEEPMQIDHINGIRSDNRFCNLRNVSPSENRKNMRLSKLNTSGINGVAQMPNGRWHAKINIGGQCIWLGAYDSIELATAARVGAERVAGFHPNHGRTTHEHYKRR